MEKFKPKGYLKNPGDLSGKQQKGAWKFWEDQLSPRPASLVVRARETQAQESSWGQGKPQRLA